MKVTRKLFFVFLLVVSIIFLIIFFDLKYYLDKDNLTNLINGSGIWAPIAFIAIYVFAIVSLIPASIFSLIAGAFFGTFFGFIYVVIAASLGALISFIASRYFLRDFIENSIIKKFSLLKKYDNELFKRQIPTMLLLRLAPVVPFSILNYFLGITKVSFNKYLLTTVLGIIPGTFVYVYFGNAIFNLKMSDIVYSVLLLLFLTMFAVIYGKLNKKHNHDEYDIAVIGAGSGGLNIASFMNNAGFKTLLIDKSDKNIGGDCLNFGCVPSKALIHVSRLIKKGEELENFGLKQQGSISIDKVREYVKSKIEYIREHENAEYFRNKGMEVLLGEAKFISPHTLKVGDKEVGADKIVIATGSRPFIPPVKNLKESGAKYYTNETIFSLENIPEKLLVIGGGPIGIELGQALHHLGSKVTIVEGSEQILSKEDFEIANLLSNNLKKDGIKIKTGFLVKEIIDKNTALISSVVDTDNKKEEVEISFDAILVSAGRRLNIDNLDLEKANIKLDEKFKNKKIKVDKYLRTTNKKVFLCGDILGQHQFTHAAELHASTILKNIFTPLINKKLKTDSLSWVTYTSPELATFGLTERDLKERRIKYKVLESDFEDDDRAITDNYSDKKGKVKLFISDNKKEILLGGTMLAPNAGELIQELILLQKNKMSISKIFEKIYPYPTATRINKRVVSSHYSSKLNKTTKKLLKILY